MQFVAPDILSDVAGFSPAVSCPAFGLGLLLWLLGWRKHRFWIVFLATLASGLVGLYSGAGHATQPIVAGVLLAVAVGAMALALVRVIAFGAGGVAASLVMHALAPQWQQPLISFLAGGLVGLLLFRVWTMVLTSAAGTLLMAYSGLCLVKTFAKVDVVALAETQTTLISWICTGVVLLGLVVQLLLDRPRKGKKKPFPKPAPVVVVTPPPPRPWWSRIEQLYRRAG
jgi:hypothetical protein